MEAGSTFWSSTAMRTDGAIPQFTHHRPPRERQHSRLSISALLVARNDHLGGTIHSRMRTLSTEQNTYHKEENPSLSHPRRPINAPIQCRSSRPHHSATKGQQVRCNPHCSRSRMLQSSHLPPMSYDHHRGTSGPPIPQKSIPMVRGSFKSNI